MALPTHLLVFREASEKLPGRSLALLLDQAIARVTAEDTNSIVSALIIAGELECALADVGGGSAQAASLTDLLAGTLLGIRSADRRRLSSILSAIQPALPESVRVSPPEGFAYYALHPADFADVSAEWADQGPVAVIGIRSIGTTLSAVTTAALTRCGIRASRITVRPEGHPYDRKLELAISEQRWVAEQEKQNASFVAVDEGPGLSGSSFLCVAEALESCGINPSRITLFGTRDPDPKQLCARDAAQRWRRYNWRQTRSTIRRTHSGQISVSGGAWRNEFLGSHSEWPACWPEMEPLKFLDPERRYLAKFEGLGPQSRNNLRRAEVLFATGFAPRASRTEAGMTRYEFISGSPLSCAAQSTEVLDRIAEYCAFRAANFRASVERDQLAEMVHFNLFEETKYELRLPAAAFECESPIVPDCRMQPHKWIRTGAGTIVKVDGAADGEGHFLPGATDVLWDLAGAIVEWNMNPDAQQYLLAQFQRRHRRVSQEKLAYFVLAYSIFRLSYCKMAYCSTQTISEKTRLGNAALYYERMVDRALERQAISKITRQIAI
jgi:hypothetical protein